MIITQKHHDGFGIYEIADAEKFPLEERLQRNRIYDDDI